MDVTGKKVDALIDLVEAMATTHQDMYNKVEFLEKRLNLVEKVNDYQDQEMDNFVLKGVRVCRSCCEGEMQPSNSGIMYPSDPPKYEYKCNKCDFVEIL